MAELPSEARCVVIGGGIIGCSVAYHLAKLGWQDVVLLERKRLTSGTTWHAAGLIGQLRGSSTLTKLAKYSAALLPELEAETGLATGYRQNGSLSLALSDERLEELKRQATMGKVWGVEAAMVSPAEARAKHPLIDLEGRHRRTLDPRQWPGRSRQRRAGAGQGRPPARGSHLREHQSDRHPPCRRPRHRRRHERRPDPRRVHRQLRGAVGARGRAHGGRQRAAAGGRAFLCRHGCEPGHSPQPAGAARAGRVRLRQGGGRQAAGRLLRAEGQASAGSRDPRRCRVPQLARRLGASFPRAGAGLRAPADLEAHRAPHLLQRPGELHARRPMDPRRGAEPAQLLRRGRLQLDRHPDRGRGRHGDRGMDGGRRADIRPHGLRHPPLPTLPRQCRLPRRPHRRGPRPALCRPVSPSQPRERARRAHHAVARAARRPRRLLHRGCRLGARRLVPARGRARPRREGGVALRLGTADLVRSCRRGAQGSSHAASASSTSPPSARSASRAATPRPCCS